MKSLACSLLFSIMITVPAEAAYNLEGSNQEQAEENTIDSAEKNENISDAGDPVLIPEQDNDSEEIILPDLNQVYSLPKEHGYRISMDIGIVTVMDHIQRMDGNLLMDTGIISVLRDIELQVGSGLIMSGTAWTVTEECGKAGILKGEISIISTVVLESWQEAGLGL